METYHKIQTVFKRDLNAPKKPIIVGDWTLPEFEYLCNTIWRGTEKVDGTNVRLVINSTSNYEIKGKTDTAQLPAQLFNTLIRELTDKQLEINEIFAEYLNDGYTVCFYGEGYGARIQKGGGNYSKEQKFVLFDIKIGNWWMPRSNVEEIAKKLNFDIVPIVYEGTLIDLIEFGRSGFTSNWGDFKAEGIVAVPLVHLCNGSGNRIITKIKHRDFIQ